VIVVDRANAQPIEVRVTSRDGRAIGWLDARMIPGPGAQAALKTRLLRARKPAASQDRGRGRRRIRQSRNRRPARITILLETRALP
jgi:hypothetical protein